MDIPTVEYIKSLLIKYEFKSIQISNKIFCEIAIKKGKRKLESTIEIIGISDHNIKIISKNKKLNKLIFNHGKSEIILSIDEFVETLKDINYFMKTESPKMNFIKDYFDDDISNEA